MTLTLEMVQKRFPEARETYRGFGKAFLVHCPRYHKFQARYELEINAESGFYRCHNCGSTGNAKMEWFGREMNELHHLYFEREQQAAKSMTAQQPRVRRGGVMWGASTTVPAPGQMVPFASLPDDHPAVEYLRDRKFDLGEIRGFDPGRALYYCTHGQYSLAEGMGTTGGRLIFPVYKDGLIQGWQARYIDRIHPNGYMKDVWDGHAWRRFQKDEQGKWGDHYVPKYYTCPGMPRYSVLYNHDMARNYAAIAVVEGPLDQIAVGPASVGTFGKAIAVEQIRLLKTYWSKVFFIRDPDVDTNTKSYRNMVAEMAGLDLHQLVIPGNRDPGETPRQEIWSLIAKSEEDRARGVALRPSLS